MKAVTAIRRMPTAVLNEVVMDPALVAPILASVVGVVVSVASVVRVVVSVASVVRVVVSVASVVGVMVSVVLSFGIWVIGASLLAAVSVHRCRSIVDE